MDVVGLDVVGLDIVGLYRVEFDDVTLVVIIEKSLFFLDLFINIMHTKQSMHIMHIINTLIIQLFIIIVLYYIF
jgi:hypothetical protein